MALKINSLSGGIILLPEDGSGDFTLAVPRSSLATQNYVDTSISAIIDSAPGTLNTLNELAAALGDDSNFATTITNSISLKAPIATPTFTGTVSADILNVTGTFTAPNYNNGDWDNAFSWGDHSLEGYLANSVSLSTEVTGTLPVSSGGLGTNTLSSNGVVLGNGTSAVQTVSPGTSGNLLTSNGTTWQSVTPPAAGITYVAKTSTYTTQDLEGVLADTTSGSFTVNLPSSPSLGDQCVVADEGGLFATNNLTVGRNGSTINDSAEDLILDINGVSVQFIYSGSTWEVYSQVGGNGGDVVNTTASQILTNKTIRDVVYTLSGTALDATNGATQAKTLTTNVTFTDSLLSGDSMLLMLSGGNTYTVTWPSITWVTSIGDVSPALTTQDSLVIWKVSSTLYGAYVGSYE